MSIKIDISNYKQFIQTLDRSDDHLKFPAMSRYQIRCEFPNITVEETGDLIAVNRAMKDKSNTDPIYRKRVSNARKLLKDELRNKYVQDKNQRFVDRIKRADKINVNGTLKRFPNLTYNEVQELQTLRYQLRDNLNLTDAEKASKKIRINELIDENKKRAFAKQIIPTAN